MGPSNSAEYDEGGTWSDTAAGGGKCAKDTLVITGPSDANANVPTICGQNTGQHSKISHLRCVPKVQINKYNVSCITKDGLQFKRL